MGTAPGRAMWPPPCFVPRPPPRMSWPWAGRCQNSNRKAEIDENPTMNEPPAPAPSASGPGALSQLRVAINEEVGKVVVGQTPLVDATLAAIAVGGHLLLQGPPGVAKTLLASAVARAPGP